MRLLFAQPHAHARAGHGFEEVENIGWAGAREGRDGVELFSLSTHRNSPVDAMMASTLWRSGCVTAGRAYSALMPLPTRAGVLGMVRTTRSEPSHWAMLSERMPAATLRCSAACVWACLRGGVLEGLGLDGPDHDARALQGRARLGLRLNAVVLAQRLRASAQGSTHFDLAGWPWWISPPMMALAMLPPPMKAMVGGMEMRRFGSWDVQGGKQQGPRW